MSNAYQEYLSVCLNKAVKRSDMLTKVLIFRQPG